MIARYFLQTFAIKFRESWIVDVLQPNSIRLNQTETETVTLYTCESKLYCFPSSMRWSTPLVGLRPLPWAPIIRIHWPYSIGAPFYGKMVNRTSCGMKDNFSLKWVHKLDFSRSHVIRPQQPTFAFNLMAISQETAFGVGPCAILFICVVEICDRKVAVLRSQTVLIDGDPSHRQSVINHPKASEPAVVARKSISIVENWFV